MPDPAILLSRSPIRPRGPRPEKRRAVLHDFPDLLSGRDASGASTPYFGDHAEDFFDCVIIDERHRGGAGDESEWRKILEILAGLAAWPDRDAKAREKYRVETFMNLIDQREKTLVFCTTQDHTLADPDYCVRVTANDGEIGDQFLEAFRQSDKTIPTVLTTSQKLSTGVDCVEGSGAGRAFLARLASGRPS